MTFEHPTKGLNNNESEESYFHKKAVERWINISKTIFYNDKEKLRKLLFSINSNMYHELKEFADSLSNPKYVNQLNSTKLSLKSMNSEDYVLMEEGIEMLEKIITNEHRIMNCYSEKSLNNRIKKKQKVVKKQSIITPLMMLKRGRDNAKTWFSKQSKRANSIGVVSDSQINPSKVNFCS